MSVPEPKVCETCGRLIEWRKKWERDWDEVRYCSKSCRSTTLNETDAAIEGAIVEMCRSRGRSKTICPSEAAKQVDPEDWQQLMDRTRWAANRLAASGRIVMLQGGRVVEPSRARGAIRLRIKS